MKKKVFVIIIINLIAIILTISGMVFGMYGLYLNSDYYYASKLEIAIQENNIAEVQRIVSRKPNAINTYPTIAPDRLLTLFEVRIYYPFNTACSAGNIEMIELLIENGANVNCNDGHTPLSMVYNVKPKNWYKISQILIENGASLDYTTEYSGGKSPILQDIVDRIWGHPDDELERDNEEEVMLAFKYALAHCNHNNVDWGWVLKNSISGDRIEIVKLLLDDGYCNVNDNTRSMTPLMFAARDSTAEMVQLLLDYGADKSIKTDDGKTAYDYAVQFSKDENVIAILTK